MGSIPITRSIFDFAVVAQLVERHLAKVEVASPSLVYRSMAREILIFLGAREYAPLAQLVEHLTLNQGVEGSNPSSRTKALFLVDLVAGDGVFLLFKSYIVL